MTIIRVTLYMILSQLFVHCYGTGSPETTRSVSSKQQVNIWGTLSTTHNPETEQAVEGITISGKINEILTYETPSTGFTKKEKEKGKEVEMILDTDPNTGLKKVLFSLSDIVEIISPYPDQVWVYNKPNSTRRVEFVEIHITWKKSPASHQLIPLQNEILCEPSEPGDQTSRTKDKITFRALRKLTIQGECTRDIETGQCPVTPYEQRQSAAPAQEDSVPAVANVQGDSAPVVSKKRPTRAERRALRNAR